MRGIQSPGGGVVQVGIDIIGRLVPAVCGNIGIAVNGVRLGQVNGPDLGRIGIVHEDISKIGIIAGSGNLHLEGVVPHLNAECTVHIGNIHSDDIRIGSVVRADPLAGDDLYDRAGYVGPGRLHDNRPLEGPVLDGGRIEVEIVLKCLRAIESYRGGLLLGEVSVCLDFKDVVSRFRRELIHPIARQRGVLLLRVNISQSYFRSVNRIEGGINSHTPPDTCILCAHYR